MSTAPKCCMGGGLPRYRSAWLSYTIGQYSIDIDQDDSDEWSSDSIDLPCAGPDVSAYWWMQASGTAIGDVTLELRNASTDDMIWRYTNTIGSWTNWKRASFFLSNWNRDYASCKPLCMVCLTPKKPPVSCADLCGNWAIEIMFHSITYNVQPMYADCCEALNGIQATLYPYTGGSGCLWYGGGYYPTSVCGSNRFEYVGQITGGAIGILPCYPGWGCSFGFSMTGYFPAGVPASCARLGDFESSPLFGGAGSCKGQPVWNPHTGATDMSLGTIAVVPL